MIDLRVDAVSVKPAIWAALAERILRLLRCSPAQAGSLYGKIDGELFIVLKTFHPDVERAVFPKHAEGLFVESLIARGFLREIGFADLR